MSVKARKTNRYYKSRLLEGSHKGVENNWSLENLFFRNSWAEVVMFLWFLNIGIAEEYAWTSKSVYWRWTWWVETPWFCPSFTPCFTQFRWFLSSLMCTMRGPRRTRSLGTLCWCLLCSRVDATGCTEREEHCLEKEISEEPLFLL